MKKNFLFSMLAVLLAGFWFGGASLADCTVTTQGDNEASLLSGDETHYCSLLEAVAAAQEGNTVTLLKNIALTSDVTVDKSITLDLDGKTISFTNSRFRFGGTIEAIITGSGTVTSNMVAMNVGTTSDHTTKVIIKNGTFEAGAHCIQVYGELEVEDATIQSTATYSLATNNQTAILFADSAKGTLKGGVYSSVAISGQALTITKSDVTIDSATITSAHVGIDLNQGSKLTISGGNITAENNCAVFMNGKNGRGGNNLIINGGTFIGNIQSEGGIACGVAAFNDDTVEINGGTFNITDGVGIVARGGTTILGENVSFNISNSSRTSGKVGDSDIVIPVGYEMVMDVAAGYYDNLNVENKKGETYVIAGTTSDFTGYTVKYGDDESEKTIKLKKSGTSAIFVTAPATPTGKVWVNSETSAEYDFDAVIASDVELVLNDLIESIEISGVVAPVAGATPITSFTTTTSGITLGSPIWSGDDDSEVNTFIAGSGYKLTIPFTVNDHYILTGGYTATANTGVVTTGLDFITISGLTAMYSITFDGGNEVLATSGDTVSAPTVSKECNSLDGWYNGDEKVTFPLTVTGNLALTSKWTYTCSRSSGGGGGSSRTTTTSKDDTKANTGDTAKTDEQKVDENKTEEETVNEENKVEEKAPMTDAEAVSKFGQEQIDAYKWALENGITTMKTVEEARLDQPLTRAELAKMMVVYIAKILEKQPVLTGDVNYQDVKTEELGDLAGYIKLAYQYQIMGINADGTPIDLFNPNGLVSRGEYATVFSRVLFGALFNKEGEDFYTNHLKALEAAGILSNTEPTIQEMRGWVMLMMYRSSKNTDKIAEVISTLGASEQEAADAQSKAEEEKVAEASEADATTGDVAEAPEAEATTGDVAETPAEASTGDTASN